MNRKPLLFSLTVFLVCALYLCVPVSAYAGENEESTITYFENGGENRQVSVSVVSGKAFKLPANLFIRSGYIFCGWTAFRVSDRTWYTDMGFKSAKEISQRGLQTHIFGTGAVFRFKKTETADTIIMFAKWKHIHFEAVNHKGWYKCPDECISGYKASLEHGFTHLDGDIQFTKDKTAVLIHDDTVDRTSDGTGNVGEMTLAELKKLDFGIYIDEKYKGERILTLEEFLNFCKENHCKADLELKVDERYTKEEIQSVVQTAKACGMERQIFWASKSFDYLNWIKAVDSSANIAIVRSRITANTVYTISKMKTVSNRVFISARYTVLTDAVISLCKKRGVEIAVWTIDDEEDIRKVNPYVSSVISNKLNVNMVLN